MAYYRNHDVIAMNSTLVLERNNNDPYAFAFVQALSSENCNFEVAYNLTLKSDAISKLMEK